jgi:hypothetical protein
LKKIQTELNLELIHIILGVHCCLQDEKKVLAWMYAKNFNLGGMAPVDLIRLGKIKRVLQFVNNAANKGEFEDD